MLIAVSGASGHLGRRVMAYFKRKGWPALALVRSPASLSHLPKGTAHRVVDFSDSSSLREALRGVTHIVNAAGSIDTTQSESQLRAANVEPTRQLLAAAEMPNASRRSGASVPFKRFVHVSSISVYGKHLPRVCDEHSPRQPDDAYSRTKLEAERLVIKAASQIPVVVLQPGILYGPGFATGFYSTLSKIKNGKMALIGNGDNHVPLVHVDDVASAIGRALFADVKSGSVFLICGEPITQKQAFAVAAKLLHARPPTQHVSPRLAIFAAWLHVLVRRLQGKRASLTPELIRQLSCDRRYDCSSARRRLGWRPTISFKAGAAQVLSDYIQKHD